MSHPNIGFLGAGHMNRAILSAILTDEQTNITPDCLSATCQTQEHAQAVGKQFNIRAHCDNAALVHDSDVIILGVKPQQMHDVLTQLSQYNLEDKLIITLAAGIELEDYRKILGDALIVRAMPNIASEKQAGLTALYSDIDLLEEDEALIESIFNSAGSIIWLDDEIQLDGIIALSGSGLAFMFRFMQSMAQAGEQFGFEADELFDILSVTAMGAATLALESEDPSPSFKHFCDKIAVAGGTTAEGIKIMESHDIDTLVRNTFTATIEKNRALKDDLTKDW